MELDNPRQRMQALAAAQQPVREWVAGAQALALLHGALQAGIVEAVRTPRTVGDIAADSGIAPERATRMLMEHQQPIKQSATAVGYPDVRYFTSLFHKRIGVTPAVFRKDHGTLFLAPGRHEQPEG